MKKTLLLSLSILMGTSLFAQVPNGSFETWNTVSVDVLKGWNSQGKHEKVAGPNSDDAVRVSTDQDGNVGVVAYVDFSEDLANLKGGFAYPGKPIKLRANLRYNIPAGDTAAIIISTSFMGQPMSLDLHNITGSQNTFVDQEFSITYFTSLVPDSVVLGFTSGSIDGDPVPGGWVEVSKVDFLDDDGKVMTAIPNGDFSQWEQKTHETLASWNTSTDFVRAFGSDDEPVKKDPESTSGNYSLMLKTLKIQDDTIPGLAFTTKSKNEFDVEQPTFKVTKKHLSVEGKYKYLPEGNDSFTISTVLYFQGSLVAYAQFKDGGTTDSFKFFSMPITYATQLTPDSATIAIFNTDPDVPGAPGSTLWVDEISLKEWTTDVPSFKEANFEMYPNPSRGLTQLKFDNSEIYTVSVYNLNGVLINTINNIQKNIELDLNNLAKGVYLIKAQSNSHVGTKKLIIE